MFAWLDKRGGCVVQAGTLRYGTCIQQSTGRNGPVVVIPLKEIGPGWTRATHASTHTAHTPPHCVGYLLTGTQRLANVMAARYGRIETSGTIS